MVSPLRAAPTLQGAAKRFVDALVHQAPHSTVLARVLVTHPYRDLPNGERVFADRLAKVHGVRTLPETPVLALLASRGVRPEWNDARASRSHRAVPLTDPEFVRSMPMVARMLDDLGFPLDGLGPAPRRIGARLGDRSMGVFHVRDASAPENASLIPARGFVAEHGIRSVFGLGSAYLDGSVLVVLVFSQNLVDHETVVRLAPLAASLKQRTYALVAAGRIFDDDA
jgi:hypothetical protein